MPAATTLSRFQNQDAVTLHAPDGGRATVLLHGGHVVSWIPAGADEQLYLSPKSGFADGQAIRGGVPVIFPQFNARGPLQRHGFARNRRWESVQAAQHAQDTQGASAVLRLCDDAASRAVWPHAFALDLRVTLGAGTLDMQLSCHNTGTTEFRFMAALHTYLRLDDLASCQLQGLAGLRYWDAVADTTQVQQDDTLLPGGDLDRVYYGVDRRLVLREGSATRTRRLQISQPGFGDAVVWNPGPEKCAALADMPADGYRHMLCVEAAAIAQPVVLAPQAQWQARQTLTLL